MLGCKGLTPGVTGKNFPQLRTLMLLERRTKNNKFNQTNKNTFLPKSLRGDKNSLFIISGCKLMPYEKNKPSF